MQSQKNGYHDPWTKIWLWSGRFGRIFNAQMAKIAKTFLATLVTGKIPSQISKILPWFLVETTIINKPLVWLSYFIKSQKMSSTINKKSWFEAFERHASELANRQAFKSLLNEERHRTPKEMTIHSMFGKFVCSNCNGRWEKIDQIQLKHSYLIVSMFQKMDLVSMQYDDWILVWCTWEKRSY